MIDFGMLVFIIEIFEDKDGVWIEVNYLGLVMVKNMVKDGVICMVIMLMDSV